MRRIAVIGLILCSCADDRTLPGAEPAIVEVLEGTAFPDAGKGGFPLDTEIRISFSGPIAPETVTYGLRVSAGTEVVSGTAFVDWAGETLVTLVFVPEKELKPNTTFEAQLTDGVRDALGRPIGAVPGKPPKAPFKWSFKTGPSTGSRRVSPGLVRVAPAADEDGVSVRVRPLLTFTHAMDLDSLKAAVLFEEANGAPVAKTLEASVDGRSVTVVPGAPLTKSTTYRVTVTRAAKAIDGRAVAASRVWGFTTSSDLTHLAPLEVVSTVPAANATNLVLRTPVKAEFWRGADAASITDATFRLRADGASSDVDCVVSYDKDSRTATLAPKKPLLVDTPYTATVDGVKSDEGVIQEAPYSWHFRTTADAELGERPKVVRTTPTEGIGGISRTAPVVIAFSKPIDASSVTAQSVMLKQGATEISAQRTLDTARKVLTVTPDAPFGYLASIELTLAETIKDGEGLTLEPFPPLTFTTEADVVAPEVLSTSPPRNATEVSLNAAIRFTMSEAVVLETATITLAPAIGGSGVAGQKSYDAGTATLVFTPSAGLPKQVDFIASLSGVEDLAGNALVGTFEVPFRSGGVLDTTPPTFGGLGSAVAQGESVARLTWTAATDAVSPQITYRGFMAKAPATIDFSSPSAFVTAAGVVTRDVSGLEAGATYEFAVRAKDGAGNEESNTFKKTLTMPDLTAPSFGGASSVTAVAGQQTLTVVWAAGTDNVSATNKLKYRVYVAESAGAQVFTAPVVETAAGATQQVLPPSGGAALVAGRTYFVVVRAIDEAGNESQGRVEKSAVVNDIVAPTFAGGVRLSATSRTSMTIDWDAASDAVTPANALKYRVFKRKVSESAYGAAETPDVVGSLSKSVGGLEPGVPYKFKVTVSDASGNEATNPNEPSDSTDNDPPVWTGGVSGVAVTTPGAGKATLTWNVATDARSSPVTYRVFKAQTSGAVFSATPDLVSAGTTTKAFTGLAGGTWFFGVRVVDAVDNEDTNTTIQSIAVAAPPVVWNDIVAQVVGPRPGGLGCTNCHSGVGSYASVTGGNRGSNTLPKMVTPGSATNSSVYRMIAAGLPNGDSLKTTAAPGAGPSWMPGDCDPPSGNNCGTHAQVLMLKTWIDAGALEN